MLQDSSFRGQLFRARHLLHEPCKNDQDLILMLEQIILYLLEFLTRAPIRFISIRARKFLRQEITRKMVLKTKIVSDHALPLDPVHVSKILDVFSKDPIPNGTSYMLRKYIRCGQDRSTMTAMTSNSLYHSGGKYTNDAVLERLLGVVTEAYLYDNVMQPKLYPKAAKLERQAANYVQQLTGAGEDFQTDFTSGGTESLRSAVYACREYGRDRMSIAAPNIVAPATIHQSVEKACHMLNVELRQIKFRCNATGHPIVDLQNYRQAIDKNTICLMASACDFPCGLLDPVVKIGKIAGELNIPFHLDACLGSGTWLYLPRYAYLKFGSIPSMTSMSVDLHKSAGCTPKGVSALVMKRDLMSARIYLNTTSTMNVYGTRGETGSKSALPAIWTLVSLLYHGMSGLQENAQNINRIAKSIAGWLDTHPDVMLYGIRSQVLCTVAVAARQDTDLEMHKIVDIMASLDNGVKCHATYTPDPESKQLLQFTVTATTATEDFLRAFKTALDAAIKQFRGGVGEVKVAEPEAGMYMQLRQELPPIGSYSRKVAEELLGFHHLYKSP